MRQNFISRNEGFICNTCGTSVPAAKGTCRNHCTSCLTSLHVDDQTPGDRASTCKGIMPAISVSGTDPDALVLLHKCSRCGKEQPNKVAPDDDRDAVFKLFELR